MTSTAPAAISYIIKVPVHANARRTPPPAVAKRLRARAFPKDARASVSEVRFPASVSSLTAAARALERRVNDGVASPRARIFISLSFLDVSSSTALARRPSRAFRPLVVDLTFESHRPVCRSQKQVNDDALAASRKAAVAAAHNARVSKSVTNTVAIKSNIASYTRETTDRRLQVRAARVNSDLARAFFFRPASR
jgi:hypothetical protein